MNRAILAAAVVPALAGCAANATRAQEPRPATERTIVVHASASVNRAPDLATARFAVETDAADARSAARSNAATAAAVVQALRDAGVGADRIRTLQVELSPRYSRPEPGGGARITGYRALNQVVVALDDMASVGVVIDAAIDAGANRVNGISFDLADPEEARLEALGAAVAKARREAEAIARALGEPLGPVKTVTTAGVPAMEPRAMRLESAAPSMPVEPGTVEIRADVTVVFFIGRP
jgi:uncharacterized protein YggE